MIKIYKNDSANAIFIEDDNGAQFINSIQAVVLDPNSTKLSIYDNVKGIYLVYEEEHSEFINENGVQWGSDAQSTSNSLNATFMNSGTPTGDLPQITSPLSVDIVVGSTLNYELTASFGVGYEWDLSNVSGITTVEGNVRKLIGGSSLATGSYNIPVKAINYNGEDSQTLVLNVTYPAFANTISTEFNNNQWLSGNAGILQNVLGRTSNGSGASDAWSISLYFKIGTYTGGSKQTIFYFGSGDHNNGGHIWVYYKGNEKALYLEYGSKYNYIKLKSSNNSLSSGNWSHFLLTYDGGTTGSSSGSINNYYSRFGIFINGALISTTNSNSNYGWSSSISSSILYQGKRAAGNDYMKNSCKIDELAIWDSDQSANIATIYNSGSPRDLSLISSVPLHWWRMGDGDTYPYLQDSGSQSNLIFIMNNMSSSSFVNDTP